MATNPEPVSRGRILAYALPAIPLAAVTLPLYILLPTFYTEAVGLSLAAVSGAFVVVRIFDAINDPIIGIVADKIRTSFGRRRTMFTLALPVVALAAFMLFWPPADATASYITAWGVLLTVGYTMAIIPLYAWGAELAGDYRTRTSITGWREGFVLAGTLIAISIPFALGVDDASGFHGLALLAIVIAVALPLFGLFTVWRVPEPQEYTKQRLNMRDGFRYLRANKPFIRLVIAFFINGLANGIPATLFLYFVSDYLGETDQRGPLLFLYFLCGIAGVPLANFIAGRTSKHRAWCYGMIAAVGIFALTPLLSEGDVALFAIICALTGLLLGFDLSIPPAIQADVIDVDTAQSGEQRSGIYFAAWSFTTKMSLALAVGVAFPLLAVFGFDPEAATQSDQALTALAMTYAWLPALMKLCAIALMWNFPLDEAMQRDLRARIEG
ncbi:MAG: MFS transporter [Pseudomonadota bacterium]